MKRKDIIEKLLKESFTEKTLSRMEDKELVIIYNTILREQQTKGSVVMKKTSTPDEIKKVTDSGADVKLVNEKKPSAGLSIKKKEIKVDNIPNDLNEKKGVIKPIKEEEVEEWVLNLTETHFSHFTSKKEIMEILTQNMEDVQTMSKPKIGHNKIPEFMTYDSIVGKGEQPETQPGTPEPEVLPGTPTKPERNPTKTPYQPGPGTNPKPKAIREEKK